VLILVKVKIIVKHMFVMLGLHEAKSGVENEEKDVEIAES